MFTPNHWKWDLHYQLISFSAPNSYQFVRIFSQSSTRLDLNNCSKTFEKPYLQRLQDVIVPGFKTKTGKTDKKSNSLEVRDGSSHLFHGKIRVLIKENIPVFWKITPASMFLEN